MTSRAARAVAAALLITGLALAAGCAGGKNAKGGGLEGADGAPACSSEQVQRVLTYCVSPGAADFARRNEAVGEALAKGPVSPDVFPLPVGDSPALGPADAAVTLVLFSDLECPYCAQSHADLVRLQRELPEDVRLVFKHYPLSFHPNAMDAARAAMAAHEQGKFWEFIHLVYQRQDAMGPAQYEAIIGEVGGDVEAWKASFAEPDHVAEIQEDMSLGDAINVAGTPTIFLNGVALPGGVPAEELKQVVLQQREIVEAFAAAGVPRDQIYWRMVRAQYQPLPDRGEDPAQEEQAEEAPAAIYLPVGTSPTRGAAADDALVTVVLFSDFQCPFCKSANEPLEAALAKHGDSVRLVFKHFPLPFHEQADEAAAAGVLAQRAGKFWELHDLMFANQEELSVAALQGYLEQIGVEGVDLASAMEDDPELGEVIRRDMGMGIEAGVNGTPTLFINGVGYAGVPEDLDAILAQQLEAARALREETGKRGEELYEAMAQANAEASE